MFTRVTKIPPRLKTSRTSGLNETKDTGDDYSLPLTIR